jgi:hypothetical protein
LNAASNRPATLGSISTAPSRYLGESLPLPGKDGRSKFGQNRLGPLAASAASTALASVLRAKS